MNKETNKVRTIKFTSIINNIDDACFDLVTKKKSESEKALETLQCLAIRRIIQSNGL